ncbi:MAG: toprim domain-containing protein [Persephonella sp.]|nr:toprim domain-containing protein [Persephonella sp.]
MTPFSYKELYNDDDKMFLIATMGQIGERTINIIKSYIRAVKKLANVENIVVALDNDEAGRRMSEKLQSELSREFDNVTQDIPLEKDWNAELRRGYYGPQI